MMATKKIWATAYMPTDLIKMAYWEYKGPVWSFKRLVTPQANFQTKAPSKQKAINNFKYQARRELGLAKNADIRIEEGRLKRFLNSLQKLLPSQLRLLQNLI